MSATEWKFVPVEPTREMLVAALKTNGACPIYSAMLDAAPVPPSVESLLENWTPSDQQAFAKFRDEHFPGEMSSYAIQSLGSAWKDGQANAVAPNSSPGTGSDALDCILGVGGFASFGPLDAQPAHLTIPGALEWDGDNGTHGVVGTHSADGESCVRSSGPEGKRERFQKWVMATKHPVFGFLDGRSLARGDDREGYADEYVQGLWVAYKEFAAPVSAYTAVDMTTAAAVGFRDGLVAFSEDGKRNVLAEVFFQQGDEPFICAVRGRVCVEQLEAAQRDFRENLPDQLEQGDGIYTFDFYYEKGQYDEWGRCEIAPGWGFDFVSYAPFEADDEPVSPAAEIPYVPLTADEVEAFLSMGDRP